MANSRRFHSLSSRLKELRKHLLPKNFSATGYYSRRQQDLAKSYRLLTHAEIESFLEEISKSKMTSRIVEWMNNKKPSNSIVYLLTFYHAGGSEKEGEDLVNLLLSERTEAKIQESAEAAVTAALKQYMGKILSNNGVKQADLKKMVFPLGIKSEDLDPSWLLLLDTFGSSRGEVAHNAGTLTRVINPEDEYKLINDLLVGLKKLDGMIFKMK
jgi:hypothetical protein